MTGALAQTVDGAAPPWLPEAPAGLLGVLWWLSSIGCVALLLVVHRLRRQVRRALSLGQYELEGQLGEGGMGVVYRGRHAMLKRPTAVKVLRDDKTTEVDLARFEREVRLTARLTHPNIVTIYDYGRTPDGRFYYAMELLNGATLDEAISLGGPFDASRTIYVIRQLAAALDEAHAAGLIHRDIKPSNVMLVPRRGDHDVAKLLDFGLVKQLAEPRESALTRDGALTGTPLYMAPEMIRAPGYVDPRSDIYALGALAFFLLTGRPVFSGSSLIEVCSDHLHRRALAPSEALGHDLPEGLDELVLACLDKDPDRRPASAEAVIAALDAIDAPAWSRRQAADWWRLHQRDLVARHRPSPVTGSRHKLRVRPSAHRSITPSSPRANRTAA